MADEDAEPDWGVAATLAAAETQGSDDSQESRYVRYTRWIPILGRLWDCRPEHLKEAFYEVACVILFSTLPLWFFPLISSILFTINPPFFSETVSNGELLIYSASLSGSMVYFISKKYGSVQSRAEAGEGPFLGVSVSFPYGGFFIILSALICMSAAAIFFMLKVAKFVLESEASVIDHETSALSSWALFALAGILFFCAVAFRNLLDDARSYRNESVADVLEGWKEDK